MQFYYQVRKIGLGDMELNCTFKNVSVIPWRSVAHVFVSLLRHIFSVLFCSAKQRNYICYWCLSVCPPSIFSNCKHIIFLFHNIKHIIWQGTACLWHFIYSDWSMCGNPWCRVSNVTCVSCCCIVGFLYSLHHDDDECHSYILIILYWSDISQM